MAATSWSSIAAALLAACSRATSVAAPPSEASLVPPAAVSAFLLTPQPDAAAMAAAIPFCAFGGQGVLPSTASFDDYVRVILVVDLTLPPGRAVQGAAVSVVELRNATGAVEAAMRAPIEITRVDPIPAKTDWATAMRPGGAPFDGTLTPGVTRVRVEAWLTRHPRSFPLKVHVVITTPAGPIEVSGPTNGEWPTG
jgi:hypothetical protein